MNHYIEKLRTILETVPEEVSTQTSAGDSLITSGLAARDERRLNIIPQVETHVELGHPSVASAALLLWTLERDLITDGRITIVGKDIGQLDKDRYSFAQVVLVAGDLRPEELAHLRVLMSAAGGLDGCMVRLTEDKIWARVSSNAVRYKISFHDWGCYLRKVIRSEIQSVDSIETLFVAGRDDLVLQIRDLARRVGEERREKLLERLKKKGADAYECENPFDCSVCPDNKECDVLKEVAEVLKTSEASAFDIKEGNA